MEIVIASGVAILISFVTMVVIVKQLFYVCHPNELLVVSGRKYIDSATGKILGYRLIKGGRVIKMPIIEMVSRMDLTPIMTQFSVKGAYAKGNILLDISGTANINFDSGEYIHNAVELFLGRPREEVISTARTTLEGNLRSVIATLTPEEVRRNTSEFKKSLSEKARANFEQLGLKIEAVSIETVSESAVKSEEQPFTLGK